MAYGYDLYGWYAGVVADGSARSTLLVPPAEQGNLKPNFTGYEWILLPYKEPPVQQHESRFIPTFEFRDRFTSIELNAILALAYGGDLTMQSLLLKISTANNGIDLNSASVLNGLSYLVSQSIINNTRMNEILA